jgi:hypothetical protein
LTVATGPSGLALEVQFSLDEVGGSGLALEAQIAVAGAPALVALYGTPVPNSRGPAADDEVPDSLVAWPWES